MPRKEAKHQGLGWVELLFHKRRCMRTGQRYVGVLLLPLLNFARTAIDRKTSNPWRRTNSWQNPLWRANHTAPGLSFKSYINTHETRQWRVGGAIAARLPLLQFLCLHQCNTYLHTIFFFIARILPSDPMINGDSVMKSTNLPSADEEAVRRGAAWRWRWCSEGHGSE